MESHTGQKREERNGGTLIQCAHCVSCAKTEVKVTRQKNSNSNFCMLFSKQNCFLE